MKPRQGLFILDEPERAISSVKGMPGKGMPSYVLTVRDAAAPAACPGVMRAHE